MVIETRIADTNAAAGRRATVGAEHHTRGAAAARHGRLTVRGRVIAVVPRHDRRTGCAVGLGRHAGDDVHGSPGGYAVGLCLIDHAGRRRRVGNGGTAEGAEQPPVVRVADRAAHRGAVGIATRLESTRSGYS